MLFLGGAAVRGDCGGGLAARAGVFVPVVPRSVRLAADWGKNCELGAVPVVGFLFVPELLRSKNSVTSSGAFVKYFIKYIQMDL